MKHSHVVVRTHTRMHVEENKRTRYTFFIDASLLDALRGVKERDGVPESEQIRRALRAWFQEKGELGAEKSGRKRAVTR